MTTVQHTYEVHDKAGFEHALGKIVRRYKARVDLVWGNPTTYKERVQTPYGDIKVTLTKHPVTVDFSFDHYQVDGFTYLGCIQDEMMMGLITIHGNELIDETNTAELTEFASQFEDIPCHNCNRKHRRKYGHVFRVDETGEFIIFGSACAKNYFGIDFNRILKFFERINLVFTDGWDDDYVTDRFSKVVDWRAVAKYSYYWISKEGYLSGGKAREQERNSTGDWVRSMYQDNDNVMTDEVRREIREMEYPDFDELMTHDFLNGKTEGLNDFEHNLVVLQEKMNQNVVTYSSYGWMAFLVFKKYFYSEERPEKVVYTIPEWAQRGVRVKKGERPMSCEVAGIKCFNTSYGLSTLYTLVHNDVRFKWFSTRDQNVEQGDTVILNGFSIKDVEDNQYGKSVMINRARLEKTDGASTRGDVWNSGAPRVSKADKEYFERMGIDTI